MMKQFDCFDENDPLLEDGDLPPDVWRLPLAPAGLREDVLARTSAAVRGRVRRRRTLLAATVAAAYAAGIVTAFLALRGFPESESGAPMVSEVTQERPVPTPRPEKLAVKAAGDRYLNEYGDVELALNYYRRLLSLEPSGEDAEPTLDDTWLLRSLKQARLQEEHHENANS